MFKVKDASKEIVKTVREWWRFILPRLVIVSLIAMNGVDVPQRGQLMTALLAVYILVEIVLFMWHSYGVSFTDYELGDPKVSHE